MKMVITDNLGILFAGLFRPPSQLLTTVVLKDITGANQSMSVFDSENNNLFNDQVLGLGTVQIGKGTSTPTRQDTNIENPFPDSPESDRNPITLPFGFGVAKITIATQISNTGGAGSITEVCYFVDLKNNSGVVKTFLIFRDVIQPVSFIALETVNIDNEVVF